MKASEFRHIEKLNEYIKDKKDYIQIIPVSRTFENPETHLLISSIIYIVIEQ